MSQTVVFVIFLLWVLEVEDIYCVRRWLGWIALARFGCWRDTAKMEGWVDGGRGGGGDGNIIPLLAEEWMGRIRIIRTLGRGGWMKIIYLGVGWDGSLSVDAAAGGMYPKSTVVLVVVVAEAGVAILCLCWQRGR